MKKRMLSIWPCLLLFLFFTQASQAGVISPVDQLNGIATRMVNSLKQNQSKLGNLNVIRGIVNRVLLPNIDLTRMSVAVVGNYWRRASAGQRSRFKKEFARMVTTTYASALASYNDDQVKFYPLRSDYTKQNTLRIRSVIIRRNGQRIPISYDVVRSGNRWKVYDFSIENVSMVQSYRSQFQGVLASQGFAGLLNSLGRHNKR